MPPDADHIQLAHGNGGRRMRELIRDIFARHLANPLLDTGRDAVALPPIDGVPVMTTDGFTVKPLAFPGGDIGSLAVHGTLNDLAVGGAIPLYISLNAFIEEGLPVETLDRLIASLGKTAREAGVPVVCGDTKVVPRGEGAGLYLATTGIGVRDAALDLDMAYIRPGDRILVSGPVGDHGTAVLLARKEFGLRGDLISDAASVLPLVRALREIEGIRFLRDPTRGGLAAVMHEIGHATGFGAYLEQDAIPIRAAVASVCGILGYDPLHLACEGRVVAVVAPDAAPATLSAWRALPQGEAAAMIGDIVAGPAQVVLRTPLGGERFVEELEDDPLPRIC